MSSGDGSWEEEEEEKEKDEAGEEEEEEGSGDEGEEEEDEEEEDGSPERGDEGEEAGKQDDEEEEDGDLEDGDFEFSALMAVPRKAGEQCVLFSPFSLTVSALNPAWGEEAKGEAEEGEQNWWDWTPVSFVPDLVSMYLWFDHCWTQKISATV